MRRWIGTAAIGAAYACVAAAASAEDIAFVLANTAYDHNPDAPAPVGALTDALEERGFRVVTALDAGPREAGATFAEAAASLVDGDRLVVVLSGHIVSGGGRSWLLGPAADRPTSFDVGATGTPVSAFLEVAATLPGAALVLVAPSGAGVEVGPGLVADWELPDLPQGVSLFAGPASQLAALLEDRLLDGTTSLAEIAAEPPRSVTAHGFLPAAPFVELEVADGLQGEAPTAPSPDDLAWASVSLLDTEDGYARYLDRYPDGAHATAARARLSALRQGDEPTPEQREDALGLDRETRQRIQRDLSVLGHDTRGIDGIFGPGTRSAIADWQETRDLDATGFLTGNQILQLQDQAALRTAELEAEAAARRAETERQDRNLWTEAEAANTAAAYRTYLERFPDGLSAAEARSRLGAFEAAAAEAAAEDDRRAWQNAREANTAGAFRRYLDDYPEGSFAETARRRIAELEGDPDEFRDVEEQIVFNQAVALLAETRLGALGASPGRIDGQFDEATRQALRRFQRDRGLKVTGFIDQATAIQLLSGR